MGSLRGRMRSTLLQVVWLYIEGNLRVAAGIFLSLFAYLYVSLVPIPSDVCNLLRDVWGLTPCSIREAKQQQEIADLKPKAKI